MRTRILGVRLRNIRSYVDKTIVFPPSGTTVIYGDNGTGKTSILLGINYALFGLPRGQKGSDLFIGFVSPYKDDLLRAGASSAMVKVLVDHRGKLVLIERRLNGDRGGKITILSYADGMLRVESSSNYSSEDLTEKILEVLGLREDPRKGRNTYIFSNVMYVPQFNIHQTLALDDKQRRELVDRVLGLEKYMVMLNNIEKIAKGKNSVIGSELYNINKMIEDRRKTLEKINVNEVRAKLSELRGRREELDKKLSELRKLRDSLEAEKEELSVESNKLSVRMGELKNKIKVINEKEKELVSKREKLSKILLEVGLSSVGDVDKLVSELQTRKLGLEGERSNIVKKLEELDDALRRIEVSERNVLERVLRLEAEAENLKSRVREAWNEVLEMRNVVTQGVCPLCRQSITHEHGEELIRGKISEVREVAMKIVPLVKELWSGRSLQLRLSVEKEDVKAMRNELSKRLDEVLRELREVEVVITKVSQVKELHDEISKLEQEVTEKPKVLGELRVCEEEYGKISKRVEELRARLGKIKEEEVARSKELGEVSEQINNLEKRLEEYSELSEELRKLELRASFLAKIRDCLLNHIYKGVEAIENTVRGIAHERFNEYFQEYFIKLLEDQELVEASVSDFKPSVRVRVSALGEREISQPSGAQLTALGLAYRLALNRVVRDLNRELRDSVLILDEPTLGFSPERVEKLRDLIESIGSNLGKAQVLLVTHDERLLEVGDCRIRLSIDRSRNETTVDYEECVVGEGNADFQSYKNHIYNVISKY